MRALTSAMTEQERRSTLGARWWALDELRATTDVIVPSDLGSRLRDLLQSDRSAARCRLVDRDADD